MNHLKSAPLSFSLTSLLLVASLLLSQSVTPTVASTTTKATVEVDQDHTYGSSIRHNFIRGRSLSLPRLQEHNVVIQQKTNKITSTTTATTTSSSEDTSTTSTKFVQSQCLSYPDIEQILNTTQQIFITLPTISDGIATADSSASSTTKKTDQFQSFLHDQCMESYKYPPKVLHHTKTNTNYFDKPSINYLSFENYQFPPILSSYIDIHSTSTSLTTMKLLKEMTNESILFYIHSSRFHTSLELLYNQAYTKCQTLPKTSNNECIVQEEMLLNYIDRMVTTGSIEEEKFYCDFWKTFQNHKPKYVIMVNIDQIDNLQKVIHKYYCPKNNEEVVSTTGSSSTTSRKDGIMDENILVHLNNNDNISLSEWIHQHEEYVHSKLVQSNSDKMYMCQRKMRDIEMQMMLHDNDNGNEVCLNQLVKLIPENDFISLSCE